MPTYTVFLSEHDAEDNDVWGDIAQVEAHDLDALVGKIEHKLILERSYKSRDVEPYVSVLLPYPVPSHEGMYEYTWVGQNLSVYTARMVQTEKRS